MNYQFSLFPIVSTVLKAFEEETHEVEKSNNYRVDFPNPITLPVVPNQGVYPQVFKPRRSRTDGRRRGLAGDIGKA